VNRTELIDTLAASTGLSRTDAQRTVEALFDPDRGIIARTLRKSRKVKITGFGTFEARRRAARPGRNPRTGERIRIPATWTASFRVGKGLRDSLN
jgi:DNA-binding protein HU-beta